MDLAQRLSLARLPTPIQLLKSTSKKLSKEIYVWRDDLTGFNGSGNKLRKLEFLVADALAQGCDTLVTCGGPQSNHTRATSAVARELGLDVSILILPKPGFDRDAPANANLLLNRIFDAHLTWLDFDEFQNQGQGYEPYLQKEAERLRALGKKPYLIPLGGSSAIGTFGYRAAVDEMLNTWKSTTSSDAPDDLFCALGSGGTFVGLQLGLRKNQLNTRLHGVNVIGAIETAQNYVSQLMQKLIQQGITTDLNHATMIDGYVGEGYAVASDEDLRFYSSLAHEEGVLLDPCYTGKAFQGMLGEIEKNPSNFGRKILFLHSGGGFGIFAYASQYQRALDR